MGGGADVKFAISICTVNRGERTYLGATVQNLLERGVPREAIHVFPTHPETDWVFAQLQGAAAVWPLSERATEPVITVHRPEVLCHRNANGLRQVSVLDRVEADWLVMLEDDVQVCDDFLGSLDRWLEDHARPDVVFYRLLTLGSDRRDPVYGAPSGYAGPAARLCSNWEVFGAQAVVMRADHAREFAAWGQENREHFRPTMAPFQTRREDGFDKMIGYWSRDTRPGSYHLVASPHLVLHVGETSSLHKRGLRNDAHFSARPYVGLQQGAA